MLNKAKFTAIAAGVMFASTMSGAAQAEDVLIGSCIYKFDDTFMTGVRNNMEKAAADLNAEIELVDSQNRQPMQNDQVDTFISTDTFGVRWEKGIAVTEDGCDILSPEIGKLYELEF